jgi:hypothetical protein
VVGAADRFAAPEASGAQSGSSGRSNFSSPVDVGIRAHWLSVGIKTRYTCARR